MRFVLKIYTDGGARGNPGPAASAFIVYKDKNIIYKGSKFLGVSTNNEAEYNAVIIALEWLENNYKNINPSNVEFFLDSELVTRQLNGDYKIKSKNLIALISKVREILPKLPLKISFTFIYRENNKVADNLVNKEIDENCP